MKKSYSRVRGTSDFGPSDSARIQTLCARARRVFFLYGYEEIMLPVLEDAGVFVRGVGQETDIVAKQMFRVSRQNDGEHSDVVLRPEGTAQVIRFYLEHGFHKKGPYHKFFYIGPMFRGERPQKGRLRQFTHIGAEMIGAVTPWADAEMIQLAWTQLEILGIGEKELKVNSLGCAEDKQRFAERVREILSRQQADLCPDCRRRAERNPLRVLDCKQSDCRRVVKESVLRERVLCPKCESHFAHVLGVLDRLGIPYTQDPFLVRGLDYYTHTVFEIESPRLGAQSALGAGGRYHTLVEALGGRRCPAAGFALGVERLLLALEPAHEPPAARGVYVAAAQDSLRSEAFYLLGSLREAGIPAEMDYAHRSLKAQLRQAQKSNYRVAVILGEDESRQGVVNVKDMKSSVQKTVRKEEVRALCTELTRAEN
ncbi:MAG: histidine--tRNA ligase [Candidatus Omnitrophica bacterium]|nr:histidine--tRNA ligase [Candidatus Omnitrophota bacterium]